jgi:hypothetical protein
MFFFYVFTECSVDILDQRVAALSSTIEKLRSVSTKDQDLSKSSTEASYGDWKVKHDDKDCRVMYREGLKGSPFHTLLVEGCTDGTIEDCKFFYRVCTARKQFSICI